MPNVIFIATWLFLLSSTSGSTSDNELQISLKPIGFVPYRDFSVSIYESVDEERPPPDKNRTRYFYSPVVMLQPTSAEHQFLALEGKHAVSFDVVMWNEEIENIVLDYMRQHMEIHVAKKGQLKPRPFEALSLDCKTPAASANACKCANEWQLYQLHRTVTLKLICSTKQAAETVVEAMKTQPKQFKAAFQVKFKLSGTPGRKEVEISLENVRHGEFFTKLNQAFPKMNEVLITAEHTSELLDESAKTVLIESFGEDADLSSENEMEVFAAVKKLMVIGDRRLDGRSGRLWNSVFWSEENYRPDKIASELNDAHSTVEEKTQKRLVELVEQISSGAATSKLVSTLWKLHCPPGSRENCPKESDSHQPPHDPGLQSTLLKVREEAAQGSGLRLALESLLQSHGKSEKSDVEAEVNGFEEMLVNIEWNGRRFVPKPITLTRVNLAYLRSEQALKQRKISVSIPPVVLSFPVNLNLEREASNYNLYEGLDVKLRQLADQMHNATQSMNASLSAVGVQLRGEMRKKEASLNGIINKGMQKIEREAALFKRQSSEMLGELSDGIAQLQSAVRSAEERTAKCVNDTESLNDWRSRFERAEPSNSSAKNEGYESLGRKISQLNERLTHWVTSFDAKLACHEWDLDAIVGHQKTSVNEVTKQLSVGRPYHWRNWCVAVGEILPRTESLFIWNDAIILELWNESSGFFESLLDDKHFTIFSNGRITNSSLVEYLVSLSVLRSIRSQIKTGAPSQALFPPGTAEISPRLTFGHWTLSSAKHGELIIVNKSSAKETIILQEDFPGFFFESELTERKRTIAATNPRDPELVVGWPPCSCRRRNSSAETRAGSLPDSNV